MRLRTPTLLHIVLLAGTVSTLLMSAHTSLPPTRVPHIGKDSSLLHNGWRLIPVGSQQKVSDMLFGGALSPDKKLIAVVNAGYNAHHLYLLDSESGRIVQSLPLERAFNGVAWSPGGETVYVSGGGMPVIHLFSKGNNGLFSPSTPIALPDLAANPPLKDGDKRDTTKGNALLSGLAVSSDGATLYVANLPTDTLYAINTEDKTVRKERKLDYLAHPYCLKLSPDGKKLYVTQGALGSVCVLDAPTLEPIRTLFTDKHPNDMVFGKDSSLFVSCANSDSVMVLNPTTGQELERIMVTLTPTSPPGATPNSIALSPDLKTLYVANADNNDVAVVDVSHRGRSIVSGFIPTAWYPTLVCTTPKGTGLIIGSGKGMGVGPNNMPYQEDGKSKEPYTYVASLLHGLVSRIPTPSVGQLVQMSRQVMSNTPYRDAVVQSPSGAPPRGASAVPSKLGDSSPIKHILYIIKENRTYDQVLGDMKEGNGDPSLCMYGEKVTPNIHALSREFALLDNTYCNGDVSGSGHPWSTGAIATDIGERSWMQSYSGHAEWVLNDKDIYPPGGRIWDICQRRGLKFASYYYTWTTENTHRNMTKDWEDHIGKVRDFVKADMFIKDLHEYEKSGDLPSFTIMDLREDHTSGTGPRNFTPQACVASNDLGVGKIVEACSHSKYWPKMAIFIIEDDGQDGPDHVEAHRTEALVLSPYTRRHKTVSTMYSTTSLLRTMELILGLPPMTQYDAAATPMYDLFSSKPDLTPYRVRAPQIDITEKNKPTAFGAAASQGMDFAGPDRLSARQVYALNRILWHTAMGANRSYPAPTRRNLPGAMRSGSTDADD